MPKSADDAARRLLAKVSELARGAANEKMAATCGRKVKYAYVPQSAKVCGFCCMMASRGFDFRSDAKPKLHKHCDCKLIPEQGAGLLADYDPGVYEEGYRRLFVGYAVDGTGNKVPRFKEPFSYDATSGEIIRRERSSGGILDNLIKQERAAAEYYDHLRGLEFDEVTEAIASGCELDIECARQAFRHLMLDEHVLDGGSRRFDPDPDIAASLKRIIEGGKVLEHDRILIEHENLESEYMRQGLAYTDAHNKTNETYDYAAALERFKSESGGANA